MKVHHSILRLAAACLAVSALEAQSIRIDAFTLAASPQLPWIEVNTDTQPSGPPLFTLTDDENRVAGEGWAAVSTEALHLIVIVEDPTHVNNATGTNLWQGDSLQIAVDALGDGTGVSDPNLPGPMGADDHALVLALSPAGPQGWVFFTHASSALNRGELPPNVFKVTRVNTQTIYSLNLPWHTLGVSPGATPTLGIALQLNDYEPGAPSPRRAYFGRGADGAPRPGLHASLAYGSPLSPHIAGQLVNGRLWDAATPARLSLGIAQTEPVEIRVRLAQEIARLPVPGAVGLRHFAVIASASDPATQNLEVEIWRSGASTPLARETWALTHPRATLDALVKRLDDLIAPEDQHPLFVRHLRSVRALMIAEWNNLALYRDTDPRRALAVADETQAILAGFEADAGEWAAYLDGRRSLINAYLSRHDGSLQFYFYNLPRDWDPAKAYPLFFELHGAGSGHPIGFLAPRLSLGTRAPDLHGYTTPKTYAEIERNGYWVHPFGRGNLGHRGIAETSLFEVYDQVHRDFTIDEDRRYLYGFSMGGGGTWANALRTPDHWAAIAIFAGAPRETSSPAVVANLRQTPVWIWCGEDDRLFPRHREMVALLEEVGAPVQAHSTPGVGHSYLGEKQYQGLKWLQQHVRRRPAHFSFTADTEHRLSTWGITLSRELAISGLPSFEFHRSGGTITLTSAGTTRLDFDPAPLQIDGPITLTWNGQIVYSGPARSLRLHAGQATPL
jgi:predicted esterase